MNLGLGLSICQPSAPAGPTFDRATLALTAFLKNYSGSPWAGTASGGTSASNSFTEATNAPTADADGANFDGTNDILTAGGTLATYATATAYAGWALVYVDAISTNAASSFNNDAILSTTGGAAVVIYLKSTGVVGLRHFGGSSGELALTTAFSTGTWQLVQWKYNGTNAKIRVNGGAWASVAPDALAATSNPVALGRNFDGAQFLDGKIKELALSKTAFTDDEFDDILDDVRADYSLPLA